jgi:spoIIIJ-associated protein
VSEPGVQVEASGETVGEARWAALHELERRYPALDRSAVEYVVLSEGARGLLGVGYEPARVIATLTKVPSGIAATGRPMSLEPAAADSPAAAAVRELLQEVVSGLGLAADVEIRERADEILAVIEGDDLGLVIGKHGQTIDAIQYLANAILYRRFGRGVEVIVDAQGYRRRRERTLTDVAVRAVAEVRRTGQAVELEPMTSAERKIIHTKVQEVSDLETASEGREPNRFVVVRLPTSR